MHRVRVYWNYTAKKFSIQTKRSKGWRVAYYNGEHHDHWYALADVKFHVSETGRQRVLNSRVKNVHAWVEGEPIQPVLSPSLSSCTAVRYNPFRDEFFNTDGNRIEHATILYYRVKDGRDPELYISKE